MPKKNGNGISNLQSLTNQSKKETNEIYAPSTVEPVTPKSELKQEKPQKSKANKQKYLRLDITEYQEYVALMAEHMTKTNGKYTSMTQYILGLIEADKQEKIELYNKLEEIQRMKLDVV